MRIVAKAGKPATVKLDKREIDQLKNAAAICETLADHVDADTKGNAGQAYSALTSILEILVDKSEKTE